jgi:protein-L-isoaspartate(D-aspartate) O-methyltransferase
MVLGGCATNSGVKRRGVLCVAIALVLRAQDRFAAQRERMVREQIASRGIRNPAVLQSMRTTPRELFIPPEMRSLAYEDRAVSIGYGQTISQPFIVAFMTETLDVRKDHIVLEIGTGSGYQAAVLSWLAGAVYTIEIVPELAKSAAETLERLRYRNVVVREGDGYKGWPEKAPFDRILLTAAPEEVPQTLLAQLKPGGKLVAPVGGSSGQQLRLMEKSADGKISTRSMLPVMFVPMVKPPGR